MWAEYFDKELDWQFHNYGMSFQGFMEPAHRGLLVDFIDPYFERI